MEGSNANILNLTPHSDDPMDLLELAAKSIAQALELKDLLNESMEGACLVMRAEASSLLMLDDDSESLHMMIPTGPVKGEIRGASVPKDKGICGWVFQNKKSIVLNDVEKSDQFWGELTDNFQTRNMICVPLIDGQGEAFGVVQALNKHEEQDFTQQDILLFEALAKHISNAFERI